MSSLNEHGVSVLRISILLAILGFAACSLAISGEKPIPRKQLPPAVLTAFQDRYPTAIIVGQSKEQREKLWYYVIQSKDSTISRDVLFDPAGKVIEIEESMKAEDLPTQVIGAVRAKYPKAVVQRAESVKRDAHLEYEIRLLVGRKSVDVVVNSAGKLFKVK